MDIKQILEKKIIYYKEKIDSSSNVISNDCLGIRSCLNMGKDIKDLSESYIILVKLISKLQILEELYQEINTKKKIKNI